MMRRRQHQYDYKFGDFPDRRTLSLAADGIPVVQAFGYNHYLSVVKCRSYHTHPGCVELVVCLRGNCVYSTPDGEYALKTGNVFVSRADQPHALKVYHKGLRMYWLHLRLDRSRPLISGLSRRESNWIIERLSSCSRRVFRGSDALRRACYRLFEAYDMAPRKSVERSIRLKAAVIEVLMSAMADSTAHPYAPKLSVIGALVDEMRKHPEGSYPLENLADRAEMSVSNLLIAFKRQVGLSPHAFLLACRVERAKKLLSAGKSVSVIADEVGFRSPKRFSTCFRQHEGCSPCDWRKDRK